MGRESLERLRASRALLSGRPVTGRDETPVLLACAKCQRRPMETGRFRQAGELREGLDAAAAQGLRVLEVECLDVCPDGGVAVCFVPRPGSIAEMSVMRTAEDVRGMCEQVESQLSSST